MLQLPLLRRRGAALILLSAVFLVSSAANELDPGPLPDSEGLVDQNVAGAALQPVKRTILATRPAFHYSIVRAEGVLAAPGALTTTTIHTASVALHWNLGQFVSVRYRPLWTMYSGDIFEDNLGHNAMVLWQRSFVDWNTRASHRYLRTSKPLIETGVQTQQETHGTSLEAQRRIGARTLLDLQLGQTLREAETFSNFKEWSTEDWLHYQATSAISVSGGIKAGYIYADQAADMKFGELRARLRWRLTEKFHFDGRIGVEQRKFVDSRAETTDTPVYGGVLVYRPVETTSFSVAGDRAVSPSYLVGQINRISVWKFALSQRFLQRYFADLIYLRRNATFQSSSAGIATVREDHGRTLSIRIRTHLFNRGSVALLYQHKRNRSNDARFDFSGDQIGLEFTFSY